MRDAAVVAVSSSSVSRVLKVAGQLARRGGTASQKGKDFERPMGSHEQWRVDASYINILAAREEIWSERKRSPASRLERRRRSTETGHQGNSPKKVYWS